MTLMFDHFPVFEANQVLTSGHLNDVFDFLDEQTRLTRSNLIGIGVVCGLEIKLDTSAAPVVVLSKGCGVTSEGYLIVEPADLSLVSYRSYTVPLDLNYPPFNNATTNAQYPLWELFPTGEPNTTLLNSPAGFLDDKAVLLFLELKKQGLRNCSPNNCDDKGSEVTATVRRLLIRIADLDKIIAAANALGSGLTTSDLDSALSAHLNLPDVHVLRFDVLNSGPVTSNDVYTGFLDVFRAAKLAQATGEALSAAYTAFKPLLKAAYPANPFGNFGSRFGFLDSAPNSTVQVRFLQYYVDLFEDLLRAYDEFRWKGAELICVCCPPDGLFPRHLMLGSLHPESSGQSDSRRQTFLPSPAVGCCAAESKAVLQLFSRLVELTARFTDAPGLPKTNDKVRIDPQIRLTPSVLGDRPLAERAIPYYYMLNGTPPLYRLWNAEKTRRNRANQNLGYRFDEYSPPAPAFVSDPLRYDLEPYDFVRIEGHLGKDYRRVLTTLLLLKSEYRLPIDIIALRTGAYDDTQPVDLSSAAARFQDLEALYDALREELLSSLAEGAMDFYDAPIAGSKLPGGKPKLPLLKKYAPNFLYPAGSVGACYEAHLQKFQSTPYIDVDQTLVSDPAFAGEVLKVFCILFTGVTDLPAENYAHVVSIYYFSKLAEILPAGLNALAYADFENKYQDLLALVRYFRSQAMDNVPADLKSFVPQEELIDQFDQVLFDCKLEAIKAIHDEYVRRVGELKKRQFLANFLQLHPGIQHKAGVPLGGTFIVVYHDEPPSPAGADGRLIVNAALVADAVNARVSPSVEKPELRETRASDAGTTSAKAAGGLGAARPTDAMAVSNVKALALTDAIGRISSNRFLAENPDISFVIGSLTGRIPISKVPGRSQDDQASKIIATTVDALDDGIVIADFFLPYLISSDVPGMQFVLPKPGLSFTAKAGCTNSDGNAEVTVKVTGGVAPYEVAVDQAAYQALGETLSLRPGVHSLTVRDSEGTSSASQSITIADPIVIGAPDFKCQDNKYTATFTIAGGTPPYTVNGKLIPGNGNSFTTDPVESGKSVSVEVVDSVACGAKAEFTHTCPPPCTLPCAGLTLRRGYRFWLPEPDQGNAYARNEFGDLVFSVETSPGKPIDLSDKIRPIIKADLADLSVDRFPKLVDAWLKQINKIIMNQAGLNEAGKTSWLTLSYQSAGPGRLGTLWIEYFQCLAFDIRIRATFTRRDDITVRLNLAYTPEGTAMQANDASAKIPAYDGIKIDKCNPNTPSEDLCPSPPQLSLKITKTGQQGANVKLEVAATPNSGDLQFLWEAQSANPSIGNGSTFATTFVRPDATPKLVVVTAFTKAGCTATQSIQIILG
jgi:hypothetical protein